MKISQEKRDKIKEQILLLLYHSFPTQPFTAEIARDLARDEEFIKILLVELKEKGLVLLIRKNAQGETFSRRLRWRLTNKVYEIYQQRQE